MKLGLDLFEMIALCDFIGLQIDNTKMIIDCDQCVLKHYTVQDNKWKLKSSNS